MADAPEEPPPPYELRSDRLVVRCWQPHDAALLKEAVDASIDHLKPWMPWAHQEPQTLEQKVQLLRKFRGLFDTGADFIYGIFDSGEQRVLGGSGFHKRGGPKSLEIGYWVRADAVRQGVATEVVRMLCWAAFTVCRIERLDIKVEPDNEPSAAIPRRLGFTQDGLLRRNLCGDGDELRDALLFTMLREEFPGSAAVGPAPRAFDVVGEPIEA